MTTRQTEREPAPGELELIRRFLSLHEHEPGNPGDLPPTPARLKAFLVGEGLLDPAEAFGEEEDRHTRDLYEALHARVRATLGEPAPARAVRVLERTARDARLEPRYATGGPPALAPGAGGISRALGRLLAIAFLAELDGTWSHLKECANQTCTSVFYDRSKNHSARWCSMQVCGNRNKVRAWRARQRSHRDDRAGALGSP